ncbi:alpha/beta hydrolase [Paraburkholderia panacisoli]|uniref:alpha/beta hydrolase n=1 Tax=Paraburkholderia panacisoli TaxID=2603818 RepID=UPI001660019C|nr:PHB depolymerase family esterase [Paraburkholderia panacisoli]
MLGEGSYEWFEDATVNGRLDGDPQQLAASRARIVRVVDELVKKYGFDRSRVYLVGFSQGATMSYKVALTEPAGIKGIGVMSGAIFPSFLHTLKRSPKLVAPESVYFAWGCRQPHTGQLRAGCSPAS